MQIKADFFSSQKQVGKLRSFLPTTVGPIVRLVLQRISWQLLAKSTGPDMSKLCKSIFSRLSLFFCIFYFELLKHRKDFFDEMLKDQLCKNFECQLAKRAERRTIKIKTIVTKQSKYILPNLQIVKIKNWPFYLLNNFEIGSQRQKY